MGTLLTCPVSRLCGGCPLAGLDYHDQLMAKQDRVRSLLGSLGPVSDILGMENPLAYRNKAQVTFGRFEGRVVYGNYAPATHELVTFQSCQLADGMTNTIFAAVGELANRLHISSYDERTHRGCLRHVMVRRGHPDQCMVVLVTGVPYIPHCEQLVRGLLKVCPGITTIMQSVNSSPTSVILGARCFVLYGPGFITDRLSGLTYRISAASFYQVNKVQTAVLYSTVLLLAALQPHDTVIDAYCGIGTIGLLMAKQAGQVYGVELNKDAIRDALINMKANCIGNATFTAEDAGHFMSRLAHDRIAIDVVVMDPPRAGADERFLKSVMALAPRRIVYVSCNPTTLRRDVLSLSRRYKVGTIQPVDMFPFTDHVETVVLMSRNDG